MAAPDVVLVYMTAGSLDEARAVGKALVEARLAACVNILDGMRSLFHWDGAVQEETEVVVLAKTRRDLVDALVERVRAVHSYDTPCVIALPIVGGHTPFLDWIGAETTTPG